jgi:hypothetical protein
VKYMTWNYYNLTKNEDNDRLFEDLRDQLDLFQSVLEGKEDSTLKFNIKIFKANIDKLLSKLER